TGAAEASTRAVEMKAVRSIEIAPSMNRAHFTPFKTKGEAAATKPQLNSINDRKRRFHAISSRAGAA
ncbi:MAG TPA: hypothetical protein VEZ41_05005, partial [Allosphingosinicella sp.]|nr:hypothetical protein [Allosphingosinicella sp.]